MQANAGDNTPQLSLGPILFHWPSETKRDFYFRIADEAPVDRVYVGEVICSKRAPLFDPYYPEVIDRLQHAGKTVVFSTLAEIMTNREREMTRDIATANDLSVEANDAASLYHLRGKPHSVGPFFNCFNEETMAYLAGLGATHFTAPFEASGETIAALGKAAGELGTGLEVQVYGRTGLALSARCYHARAHDRVKDNCQYVCETDPDGMKLETLDGQSFLAINGIQTLSWGCVNLVNELGELSAAGVQTFRLSPHSHDMVETIGAFRDVLDGAIECAEALARIEAVGSPLPFCNGFYHHTAGHRWVPIVTG